MSLTTNLVSYWALDEASGNALDSHGANTLTDTNTVGVGTGKVAGARSFTAASSQYFTIADNTDLSTGDVDFTFQVWVNLTSKAAVQIILGKFVGTGNQREHRLRYDSTTDRFQWSVSPDGTAAFVSATADNLGSPSTGVWYLIHAWHDSVANEIGIAVDAGTPNTTSHSAGVFDSTTAFRIGASGVPDAYFDGLIDEAAFWKNRVLSSGDRTDLRNGGSGLAYPLVTQPPQTGGEVLSGYVVGPNVRSAMTTTASADPRFAVSRRVSGGLTHP